MTLIAARVDHSLARTSTGKVLAWGLNSRGQLGNGTITTGSLTPVRVKLPRVRADPRVYESAGPQAGASSYGRPAEPGPGHLRRPFPVGPGQSGALRPAPGDVCRPHRCGRLPQ